MFRNARQVCTKVGFLTVCDGPVYQGEPIVELLRRLDRELWMECVRGLRSCTGKTGGGVGSARTRYDE